MTLMVNGDDKDALIAKIASEIAASSRLDPGWKALSIVFTFDDDLPENFGYYY